MCNKQHKKQGEKSKKQQDSSGLDVSLNSTSILNRNVEPIVCRICYESSQNCSQIFCSPCQCRGSVQYVHTQCLRSWVDFQFNDTDSNKAEQLWEKKQIICELCQFPIPLAVSRGVRICTCEEFKRGKVLLFCVLVFFLVSTIAAIAYLSKQLHQQVTSDKLRIEKIVTYALLVFMFMCLTVANVGFMGHLLTRYCFSFEILSAHKKQETVRQEVSSLLIHDSSLFEPQITRNRENQQLQIQDVADS